MKRLGIAVMTLALGVAGCGDDNGNPAGPSNLTVFTVQLSPANEVPPVTNAENTARGTAVITVNSQANTIDFNVSLNSFPSTSALTAAHIHPGAAGVNGGVMVDTGVSAASPMTLADGTGTLTFSDRAVTLEQALSINSNPAGHYFNVHSLINPGGAVRGQLVKQ